MNTYEYLILGGGMTAAAAAKAIRTVDPDGFIGMISAENHPPYSRPTLSKSLWKGKPETAIFLQLPDKNFDLFVATQVTHLDPQQRVLTDSKGQTYAYHKLLLATGGTAREIAGAPSEIVYYRALDDYHKIRTWLGKGDRIGVIGGGFVGSEISASLAELGEKVTMVFLEDGIGARVYPKDLSDFVTGYFEQKGVELFPHFEIQGVEKLGGELIMRSKDGQEIAVDHIVAGLGIIPNTSLAQEAGIEIAGPEGGRGIRVDEFLQTNLPDIYSAGDIASFYNPFLQRQMRVEHEDNAEVMGKIAGLNMAGEKTSYRHLPYFYSDVFDLAYNAVGELDARLETISDWVKPYRKGVVYYLKDQKVRGILLWDVWGLVDDARALIAKGEEHTADDLAGALRED